MSSQEHDTTDCPHHPQPSNTRLIVNGFTQIARGVKGGILWPVDKSHKAASLGVVAAVAISYGTLVEKYEAMPTLTDAFVLARDYAGRPIAGQLCEWGVDVIPYVNGICPEEAPAATR